jgi:hypothetical protein
LIKSLILLIIELNKKFKMELIIKMMIKNILIKLVKLKKLQIKYNI